MRITKKRLRQIIKEELMREAKAGSSAGEGPVSDSEARITFSRGRVSGGYPDAAWFEDVSSYINSVNFEPWFDDAGWDEGTIRPEDLVGIAGDGSTISLGVDEEEQYISGDGYAPYPRCRIGLSPSGNAVRIEWGYVPEYSYREAADYLPGGSGIGFASELRKYPVLKMFGISFPIEEDEEGNEYLTLPVDDGSTVTLGRNWDSCNDDDCIRDLCQDAYDDGYRYMGCTDCVWDLPAGPIDRRRG